MSEKIKRVIAEYWGYDSFLPLQEEAIECMISGRDAVVVLPTGGGKSLCYQVPAVAMPGLAVVVSPLISLIFFLSRSMSPSQLPRMNFIFKPLKNWIVAGAIMSPQCTTKSTLPLKKATAFLMFSTLSCVSEMMPSIVKMDWPGLSH